MKNNQNEPVFPVSEYFYRVFCEKNPDPIIIFDSGSRILYLNPAFTELTGYSIGELADCLPPFPYQIQDEQVDEGLLASDNQSQSKEQSWKKKNGELIRVETNPVPLEENGVLKYIVCLWKDITERNQLKTELRFPEEKQSRLLNAIPIPIAISTLPSGIIEYVNNSFVKSGGYTTNEIVGHSSNELSWGDNSTFNRAVEKLTEKGHFEAEEISLYTREGELRTSLLSAEIIEFGNKKYMLSASVDITDRKKAEDALRESEAFNAGLLANSPTPILVLNPDGSIRYANPALEKLTGFSSDEIKGVPPFPWWPSEFQQYYSRDYGENKDYETGIFERQYKKKNGETFWCSVNVRHIKRNDSFKYHIINWMDITERKIIETALKESEAFNARLLHDAPNPILLADSAGKIHYVNPALEQMTGYSAAELIGRTPPFPWWPQDKYEQYSPRQQGKQIDADSFTERVFTRKNGETFWVAISLQAIREEDRVKFLLANWVDITERKNMEDRIVDLYMKEKLQREELQEESRARGRFISILAHELRTPVTPLLVSIGLLKDNIEKSPERVQKKLVDNIFLSTNLLARRLEELLDLGRYSRGSFIIQTKPVKISRFIGEVVSRVRVLLEQKKQNLYLSLPDIESTIEADASRLDYALTNLLASASKFSPIGDNLELSMKPGDNGFVISISGDRMELSSEAANKLFMPYHRVEQDRLQFPGLGLELALTRYIIEAHGGKIWISSEPGHGNVFSFFIPSKAETTVTQELLD